MVSFCVYMKIPEYDLSAFIDKNECDDDNHACDHLCTNKEGSYSCTCYTGYTLNEDGLHCESKSTLCSYHIL